jgi:DNA-binding IclR family transcriptional regulator
MSETNERPVNQSVAKLLQLLSVLAGSRTALRLQDVAREANMPQATCLRYLNSLIEEGFVFQDRDRTRYSLTWGICSLADQVRARQSLRIISGDIVNNLSLELDLGICLVVEHGMECMYLDCLYEPESMGRTLMRIGTKTPLHAVSSGKILLTEYTEPRWTDSLPERGSRL